MWRPKAQLAALALSLLFFAACTPGVASVRGEGRQGSVADRDTGRSIAGAEVFQVYWGSGLAGEPRPVVALRWTTTNSKGDFEFNEEFSPDLLSWARETPAAEYGFFHPDYGLVRSGPGAEGEARLTLAGQRLDTARRQAELLALCGSRPPDAIVEEVARSHCSTPQR